MTASTPAGGDDTPLHLAGDALMGVARSLAYAWETESPDRVLWDAWKKVGPAIDGWMAARRTEDEEPAVSAAGVAAPPESDVPTSMLAAAVEHLRTAAADGRPARLQHAAVTALVHELDAVDRLRAMEQRAEECSTWCGRDEMHRAVRYIQTGDTS